MSRRPPLLSRRLRRGRPGTATRSPGRAPDVPAPLHADWCGRFSLWRAADGDPGPWTAPVSGTRLGPDTAIFFDGADTRMTVRRAPDDRTAPRPVAVDLAACDSAFVSLAIDLPGPVAASLEPRHVIGFRVDFDARGCDEVFARLNLRAGPNTEQLTRHLADGGGTAEFDLFHGILTDVRADAVWIDLIFSAPRPGRIDIRDVTAFRHPRAPV